MFKFLVYKGQLVGSLYERDFLWEDETIDAIYKLALDRLEAPLVTGASLDWLRIVASKMPTSCVDIAGFECSISEANTTTDWMIGIKRGSPSARRLVHPDGEANFGDAGQASTLQRFASEWNKEGSCLNKVISGLWLEYDAPKTWSNDSTTYPGPGYFFLCNDLSTDGSWVLDRLLPYFLPRSNIETLRESYKRALTAAANISIPALAFMPERDPSLLRLLLQGTSGHVLQFLECINWNGQYAALINVINTYRPLVDEILYQFDFRSSVLNHIGLELILTKRQIPEEPRWETLLDALVKDNLCLHSKRDSLIKWHGRYHCHESPAEETRCLVLGINNIKVTVDANGKLSTKAYFGVKRLRSEATMIETHNKRIRTFLLEATAGR